MIRRRTQGKQQFLLRSLRCSTCLYVTAVAAAGAAAALGRLSIQTCSNGLVSGDLHSRKKDGGVRSNLGDFMLCRTLN